MKLNKNIFRIINLVSFILQFFLNIVCSIYLIYFKFQVPGRLNIIEDDVYTSILIITDTINSIDWLLTIVYGSKLLSVR